LHIRQTAQIMSDWLISEKIERGSDEYTQAKILVYVILLSFLIPLVIIPIYMLAFPDRESSGNAQWLMSLTLMVYILVALFFKKSGKLIFSMNFLLGMIATISVISIQVIGTACLPLLLGLPVMAELIAGRFWGRIWLMVFFSLHTVIAWGIHTNHPVFIGLRMEIASHRTVLMWLLIGCVVVVALEVYGTINELLSNEIKKQRDKFQYLSAHDPLTKIFNRLMFIELFEIAIHRAAREERMIALLYIDLDGFKSVNDSMGHHTGDTILKTTARRLQKVTRVTDCVGRIGGDEFAVVLDGITSTDHINLVAQKIVSRLAAPVTIDNKAVKITASIGISIYPFHGSSRDVLERSADKALYQAKESKNSFTVYRDDSKKV